MIAPNNSTTKPPSTDLPGPSNATLIRRLLALGWAYRGRCLAVLAQQVLLVTVNLASVGLTGLGIDVLRHHLDPSSAPPHWPLGLAPPGTWGPMAVTAAIAAAILLTALLYAVVKYVAALSAGRLTQRIVVDLRSAVYDKIQRLSFRFFDANKSGSIINRVAGDVQAVRMFVDGVVIQVLAVMLTLAVYLGYMFSMHVPLTLACLASTPLLWVGAVQFSRAVRPLHIRSSELVDQMVLTLSENIQGVHVVKGFSREQEEIDKFGAATKAVKNQKEVIFWRVSLFQPSIGFLTQLNMLVLLGYGGYLVIQGQLLLGAGLFVFANLLQQFANLVAQVTNIANTIQGSLTGAQRVFEVLDAPVEVQDRPDALPLQKPRGSVRFENVSFGYTADEPVLNNVNFTVQPGQCVAIVGATGAGKTSLLNLLPRFYDVTGGRVLIDGHDLRDLRLDDLRRCIGLVFQESFLFSNTAAANIAFGHPEATTEQIERAARIAAAHDFIMALPDGYETVIGEYGSNLSGGQKQRLAIARAMLLEPSILILDDATAAVDPETEQEILSAMDSAMQGRTTFVTAHRMSTLRRADLVIVLEGGRVAQIGTHEELLQADGHYRNSARLQILDDAHDVHGAAASRGGSA
ncbi:MAG: ABC transporter ATP-binding protein [Pirellulales bacterium]